MRGVWWGGDEIASWIVFRMSSQHRRGRSCTYTFSVASSAGCPTNGGETIGETGGGFMSTFGVIMLIVILGFTLYCGGGIAACNTALLLTRLGHENVAVYDGSMMEWSADPSLPMETG